MYPTTAKVNLSLGFIGFNLDQTIMAHLFKTALSISEHMSTFSSKDCDENMSCNSTTRNSIDDRRPSISSVPQSGGKEKTGLFPVVGDQTPVCSPGATSSIKHELFAEAVKLKLKVRAAGFSLSALHKGRLMVNSTIHGITTSFRKYGDDSFDVKSRIMDFKVDYLQYKPKNPSNSLQTLVSNNPLEDFYDKEPIIGCPTNCTTPAVEISISGLSLCNDGLPTKPKLRVSSLVECSPVEVVLVPSVIDKIVRSIMTGPLVMLLRNYKKRTASTRNQSTFEEVSNHNNLSSSKLNDEIVTFFDRIEGNVHVCSKLTVLHVLSSYSSCSSSLNNCGDQLTLEIKEASFDCAFGAECEFGGIEICKSIIGASLSLDSQSVIEPFDVSVHIAFRQISESTSKYYYIPDRRNSVFSSRWKPIPIDSISGAQLLSSIAISPIRLNMHEGILIGFQSMLLRNKVFLNHMVPQPEEKPGGQIPLYDIDLPLWKWKWDYSAGITLLLHDLTLSLQAVSVTSGMCEDVKSVPKGRQRRNVSRKTTASSSSSDHLGGRHLYWWRSKPDILCTPVTIIAVNLKELRTDFILYSTAANRVTKVNCSDKKVFEKLASPPVISFQSKLRSFDVSHVRAPKDTLCRLVATVCRSENTDIMFPTVSITCEQLFSPNSFLLYNDVVLCTNGTLTVNLNVSNLQFVLLSDTFSAISSLALLYKTSLTKCSDMSSVRRVAKQLPTAAMIGLTQKKSFECDLADAASSFVMQPENILTTTHPLSRPLLSTSDTMLTDSQDGMVDNHVSVVKGGKIATFLIDSASFSLPIGLTSISVQVRSTGCGVYLPGEDSRGTVPGIYGRVDLLCNLEYSPVLGLVDILSGKTRYSGVKFGSDVTESCRSNIPQDETEDTSSLLGWAAAVELNDVYLSLQNMTFPELFVEFLSRHDVCDDERRNNGDESYPNQSSTKFLIKPFNVHIKHFISLKGSNTCHEMFLNDVRYENNKSVSELGGEALQSGIVPVFSQSVDIMIDPIEAFVFLNYRPFIRVYKNCIQPLVELADSMASVNNLSLEVVDSMSPSVKRGMNEKTMDDVTSSTTIQDNNIKDMHLSSIFELCKNLHFISSCDIDVHSSTISINVVNDIYREPVHIFRILQNSTEVIMSAQKQSVSGALHKVEDGSILAFEPPAHGEFRSTSTIYRFLLLRCEANLQVEYQNHTLAAWEPLVEPFVVNVRAQLPVWSLRSSYLVEDRRDLIPFGVPAVDSVWLFSKDISNTMNFDTMYANWAIKNLSPLPSYTATSTIVDVVVTSTITMNVTCSLLDTIQGTVEEVEKIEAELAYECRNTQKAHNSEVYTAYDTYEAPTPRRYSHGDLFSGIVDDMSLVTLRNDTGMVLRIGGVDSIEVPVDTSCPLQLNSHDSNLSTLEAHLNEASRCINFSVHSTYLGESTASSYFPEIRNLKLEGDGCRLFLLKPGSLGNSNNSLYLDMPRKIMSPIIDQFYKPNSVCIVTELISRRGVKTLLVRSTLYTFNALSTSVKVMLEIPAVAPTTAIILWSAVVEPNTGIAIPANYCNVPDSKLYYQMNGAVPILDSRISVDVPTFPGHSGNVKEEKCEPCDGLNNMQSEKRGFVKQRKGPHLPEVESYAHWVSFPNGGSHDEPDQNVVINVVSSGPPARYYEKFPESFLSRTVTLLPTIIVTNCLAYAVEVAIVKDSSRNLKKDPDLSANSSYEQLFEDSNGDASAVPTVMSNYLASGDSLSTVEFGCTDDLFMCLRLQKTSTTNSSWSSPAHILGCDDDFHTDKNIAEAEILFENGSSLFLNIEVINKNGVREIAVYVPYWLVTSSDYPVAFQHDISNNSQHYRLNGIDKLCADQFFYDRDYIDTFNPRQENENQSLAKTVPFKLGPEGDCCGLLDVVPVISKLPSKGCSKQNMKPNYAIWNSETSYSSDKYLSTFVDQESSYKLVHFSYSKKGKEIEGMDFGSVRLSVDGSGWSTPIFLDKVDSTNVEVFSGRSWFKTWLASVRSRAAARSVNEKWEHLEDIDKPCGENEDLDRAYSFGITVVPAEYPFHRTKIVLVVDQYVLVNNTGQPLQMLQKNSSNVVSISSHGSLALSWHSNGCRFIQLRLDRHGWKWSGELDPTREGDTSLRLKNDNDSTVYFILVHVYKRGSRVFVALKGGEKIATYRIENHTIRKVRLQQLGVNDVSTTLLQYHTCLYSWDEPLKEQKFKLDIDVSENGTRWMSLGVYCFDQLTTFPKVGDFTVRVIADGPLRVLQICPVGSLNAGFGDPVLEPSGRNTVDYSSLSTPERRVITNLTVSNIGISVVDRSLEELLFISLLGLVIKHELISGTDALDLKVNALYIDNQLLSTPFPSMLAPVVSAEAPTSREICLPISNYGANDSSSDFSTVVPFINVNLRRDFNFQGVAFFPFVKVDIMPFDVNIESTIIVKVIRSITTLLQANVEHERQKCVHPVLARCAMHLESRDRLAMLYPSSIISTKRMKSIQLTPFRGLVISDRLQSSSTKPELLPCNSHKASRSLHRICQRDFAKLSQQALRVLSPPADEVMKSTTKLYIERLEISSIRMNLSFSPDFFQGTFREKTFDSNVLSGLVFGVGSTMVFDNVPLFFRNIDVNHLYGSGSSVGRALANKYSIQAVVQGLLVMLSLEAIGNPVHLVKTLWQGIYDFVSYPLQGLIKSPVEFVNGFMKGTESLCFRLIAAAAKTINRLSDNSKNMFLAFRLVSDASLFYGVETNLGIDPLPCTADDDTALRRTDLKYDDSVLRNSANSAAAVLPTTVFQGVIGGIFGLLRFPYYGYLRGGVRGLAFGAIRGTFELFTKPLFGGLSWISFAMSKCQDWVSYRINLGHRKRLRRIRPPRIVETVGSPLNAYRAEEHVGKELLTRTDNGKYRSEKYICHYTLAFAYTNQFSGFRKCCDLVVLLTEKRFSLISIGTTNYCELIWTCPLSNVARLAKDSNDSDALMVYYGNSESKIETSPLRIDAETATVLPQTTLRFRNVAECTEFLNFVFAIQPELRSAHIGGLFAARWSRCSNNAGSIYKNNT